MSEKGRPTDYREEYNIQAKKLCILGATDKQLADFFEVCEATINNWKANYPDFLVSIKESKQFADNEVEKSLYKKALGYKYSEEAATKMGIVELNKQAHPDTTAQIFWLKNRQPDKWRDKQEIAVTEHNITVSRETIADND